MSQMQLLRLFISERLSAAAEEIFAAVQRTMTEREEEEAARAQRDSDHGLKQEAHSHGRDTPQLLVFAHEQKRFRREWSPDRCHDIASVDQEDCEPLVPESPAIKQEPPWGSPEGQQLPDMEDIDTNTMKVTPASKKSCIYPDTSELQNHDTGNEDRKPDSNTSADHRKVEGNAQSSSECWTILPDCSVTLNNMGPQLGLAMLTGNIGKYHAQSCGRHSTSPPDKEKKKEFSHSAHLATHSQIHTGEKLFMCEVCGKEFRHGNSVTVHMRIHTEEKPYRCRICGKEFRHVGNLNVHTRIHTGEKPYTCTVCGKKFSRNNLMTKHMAVHTGQTSPGMEGVLRRGFIGMTS